MIKKLITAAWCSPCKMLKSKLAEADVQVDIIDADTSPEYIKKLVIRSVPTLVIEDGENVELITRYEDILDNLLG